MDPNHKNLAFGNNHHKLLEIYDIVKEEAFKVNSSEKCEDTADDPQPKMANETSVSDKPKRKFWASYESKKLQQSQKVSNVFIRKRKLEEELKRYMDVGPLKDEVDPIVWWIDEGQTQYPLLFDTAIKFLSIPATSVPSERVFSSAGDLLTKKRNRLSGKVANMMITLHKNLD